ncbi:MAG TPA: LysE family translocator [Noviherbaspirillum sp.]|jgi:threonine/homoserine/homoserine lactone efflux protein|uniref:LysE family translocator n=1 Tax=Noviherbaspirillum sp. TaxID=1926288 RepID=UPI002DDD5730|nr:LysE family translocator [Noviherbaspirillum sp.]HEV2610348.1 LysE family translocator [Noviherbaspirillum sp.]
MPDTVIAWPMLAAFLVASLVLAVTPGPAVVYIVTRTIAQGRRAGLASVAGVALGNLGNAIGASLGLAALFAVSSLAFSIVKYAGAAYLIYLGVKALRAVPAGSPAASVGMERQAPRIGMIFRDGFLVALLNPKTAMFFAAFLPQFIDPAASAVAQSILFGAAFVLIASLTDMVYVLAANAAAPAFVNLKGIGAVGRYATASVFIGLGVFTAASGSNTSKLQ